MCWDYQDFLIPASKYKSLGLTCSLEKPVKGKNQEKIHDKHVL